MTERGEGSNAALSKYEGYENWKSNIPVMYDWFTNHNLVWPSFSCRWGPQFEQGTNKNCQRLYLSEETDGFVPHTLMITNCDVVKPRVKNAEDISQVNRIRELPQKSTIVATHNNSPNVLLWDLEAQPNRHPVNGAPASRPDLILTGHGNDVEFALAMCPTEPFVLSGGRDNSLVLWSIQDHITSLGSTKGSPKLGPRGVFEGHDAIVEDVQFCPSSAQEFCSVGDDYRLIFWDARSGNAPVVKVEKAHDADVHCVDWNAQNENLILTGSADKTVHLLDRRKMFVGGVVLPIHKFEGHKGPLMSIQWCPDRASVFASAGEDGILNIWDHFKVGNNNENARAKTRSAPSGLFFRHAGHRYRIVDFHWNPAEPWTLASISHDVDKTGCGGTLQIWRMTDQLYRSEEEVEAKLKTCGLRAKSKKSKKSKKNLKNPLNSILILVKDRKKTDALDFLETVGF